MTGRGRRRTEAWSRSRQRTARLGGVVCRALSGGRTVIALVAAFTVLAGAGSPWGGGLGDVGERRRVRRSRGRHRDGRATPSRRLLRTRCPPAPGRAHLRAHRRGHRARARPRPSPGSPDGATVRVGLASTEGIRLTARGAASLRPERRGRARPRGRGRASPPCRSCPGSRRRRGHRDGGGDAATPPSRPGSAPHQVTVVVARPSNGVAARPCRPRPSPRRSSGEVSSVLVDASPAARSASPRRPTRAS